MSGYVPPLKCKKHQIPECVQCKNNAKDRARANQRHDHDVATLEGDMLMTTGDLVKLLQDSDPSGSRIVTLCLTDHAGEFLESSEVDAFSCDLKDAYQTQDGDRNCLRLHLNLDC